MRFPVALGLCMTLVASELLMPLSAFAQYGDRGYGPVVEALQNDGIIDGGPIESLRLSYEINRAEALKVILKSQPKFASSLANAGGALPQISLFSDVDQSAWYARYIELGFRMKLVTGYPDGSFRPNYGVSTEEAAVMLMRAFGDNTANAPFLSTQDLPNNAGQWYTGAVSMVNSQQGVMAGSRLQLGQNLTRGQLFDMVERVRIAHGYTPNNTSVEIPTYSVGQGTTSSAQYQGGGTIQVVHDSAALQYASAKQFAISVPSIGITDLTVTHPKDAFTQDGVLAPLQTGVGHLFAYPGEGSKVLIYGHSSGYPWDLSKYTKIFRTINKVAVGARVYVTYKGKLLVYEVTKKQTVLAKDRTAYQPDDKGEELILYTCWPPDSITHRYLIHAVPVETIALK